MKKLDLAVFAVFIIFLFAFLLTACGTPEVLVDTTPETLQENSTSQTSKVIETMAVATPTPMPSETPEESEDSVSELPTLKPSQTINHKPVEAPTQTPKPEPATQAPVSTVNGQKTITIPQLAVRKSAGTDYTCLGFLYYGTAFSVKGVTNSGWYKISYNGSDAYVDGRYLENYPLNAPSYTAEPPLLKTPDPTPTPSITPTPATPTPTPSSTPEVSTSPEPSESLPSDTLLPSPAFEPIQMSVADVFTSYTLSYNSSLEVNKLNSVFRASAGVSYVRKDFVNPYVVYTYTDMMTDINQLTSYYDFISKGSIGKSLYGRDIPYVKIGKGSKKLMICASVHAREYISSAYIMEILEQYAYYYANDLSFDNFRVKKLLDTYSIWIVPMVNPDGVAIATEPHTVDLDELARHVGSNWVGSSTLLKWKANGRGVDLNNNFDAKWSALSTGTNWYAYMSYKGPTGDSEAETIALENFCRKQRFDAAISLHTKGQIIYWDDALSPNLPKAEKLTDAICNITGYVKIPQTTSARGYGGGFENWFRKEFQKPGLCVELTPSANGEYPHNSSGFDTLLWNKAKHLPLIAIESLI